MSYLLSSGTFLMTFEDRQKNSRNLIIRQISVPRCPQGQRIMMKSCSDSEGIEEISCDFQHLQHNQKQNTRHRDRIWKDGDVFLHLDSNLWQFESPCITYIYIVKLHAVLFWRVSHWCPHSLCKDTQCAGDRHGVHLQRLGFCWAYFQQSVEYYIYNGIIMEYNSNGIIWKYYGIIME